MTKDPKEFWRVAQSFPDDKEAVYPEHVLAQEFAQNIGKVVLEYGCGGGSDTLSYLRRGCAVFFADIVGGNVLATHRRTTQAGYSGKARPMILKSSTDLGILKDGMIDVVSAHGVIHHIEAPLAVLREFHRVLQPNGKLYVMLYTQELWDKYDRNISQLVETKRLTYAEAFGQLTDGEGCPYAMAYREEDGRELLDEAGFAVISTFVYNNGEFRTFRAVPK